LEVAALPLTRFESQFRAELFNFFNHAQFVQPNLTVDAGSLFGTIRSAHDSRIVQFALKVLW
jgi:hypothetical protein